MHGVSGVDMAFLVYFLGYWSCGRASVAEGVMERFLIEGSY
jgi:hypothetical protein